MKINNILLYSFIWINAGTALDTAQALKNITNNRIKPALVYSGKFLATHYLLGTIHQAGHCLASRLLVNKQAESRQYNIIFYKNILFPIDFEYPFTKNPKKVVFIEAAGPLLGYLASYCILKLINNYEMTASKKKPESVEQLQPVKHAATLHTLLNVTQAIPYECNIFGRMFVSESQKILELMKNTKN